MKNLAILIAISSACAPQTQKRQRMPIVKPRAPAPVTTTFQRPTMLPAATQRLVAAAQSDVNNPDSPPEIREAASEILDRESDLLTYVEALESNPIPEAIVEACSATRQVAIANQIRKAQTTKSNRDARDEASYYRTFAVGLVITTLAIAGANGPIAMRRNQIAKEILTSARLEDAIMEDFHRYQWFFVGKMQDPDAITRAARIVALERAAFPDLNRERRGDFLNALDAIVDKDGQSFDKEKIRELALIHTKGGAPDEGDLIQKDVFKKLFYPFGTKNDVEVDTAIERLFGKDEAQKTLVLTARKGDSDKLAIPELPRVPLEIDALKDARVYRADATDAVTVIDKNIVKLGVNSYYLLGALAVGAAVGATATTIKSVSAKNRLKSVTDDNGDGATMSSSSAEPDQADPEFPAALSYLGKQFADYCEQALADTSVVE